jgi:hypothetical protein
VEIQVLKENESVIYDFHMGFWTCSDRMVYLFHLISMILILDFFHCSESVIFSFADNYRLFIGKYCGDSGPVTKLRKTKYHSVGKVPKSNIKIVEIKRKANKKTM